jgi:hypothetical protein
VACVGRTETYAVRSLNPSSRRALPNCELADQLGLPPELREAVGASYRQWDGKGSPRSLRGDQIPIAARLVQLAEFTEVAHRASTGFQPRWNSPVNAQAASSTRTRRSSFGT